MRPTSRVSTGVTTFTISIATTSGPLVARRYEGWGLRRTAGGLGDPRSARTSWKEGINMEGYKEDGSLEDI